eukprot:TRINITY_DN11587_c0_g2_i2.p1 TRINITY_DN11587_c0_g2~~TRINITY_DN11587_c0_g2_i2.p1  ORF type:complete len:404 (-),score=54.37 TRINITY_DN11587_c0_g2_i2:404-1615(-)
MKGSYLQPPQRISNCEFRYLTEFQSHEPEFDYLKSVGIEEKINKVKWCRIAGNSLSLVSTNDKTIKLWKIQERTLQTLQSFNTHGGVKVTGNSKIQHLKSKSQKFQIPTSSDDLRIPKVVCTEKVMTPTCRRIFGNDHVYHINSLSMNSDGETFLSADDLRINLWSIEVSSNSYCLVDLKPAKMQDLNEVITCAEFHPQHCNILTYGSSKGFQYLADMRSSALCERNAKVLVDSTINLANRGYFSEIIASVSDSQFSNCGRYMYTRDYMTVKLWDLQMERGPLKTYPIHDHLKEEFCELFENDCIFDKFDVCLNASGDRFATGSYNNGFKSFHKDDKQPQHLQATRDPMGKRTNSSEECQHSDDPYALKLLHMSWHPQNNLIAAAASNSLYIYAVKQQSSRIV